MMRPAEGAAVKKTDDFQIAIDIFLHSSMLLINLMMSLVFSNHR